MLGIVIVKVFFGVEVATKVTIIKILWNEDPPWNGSKI